MSRTIPMKDAVRMPIYDLFKRANEAASIGLKVHAEFLCDAAWARVPEPRFGWDESYTCVFATAITLRSACKYDRAINLLNDYLTSEFHMEHLYGPHFWLGTLHYEKKDLLNAYEYFDRADRTSRGRCFIEEDSRYRHFFRTFKEQYSLPVS